MDDAARPLPLHPGLLTHRRLLPLAGLFLALALGSVAAGAPPEAARPPWAVGDSPAPPWRVVAVASHPEFVRFSFESGAERAEVEVACGDGTAGPYATGLYRVQPSPGGEAAPELLRRLRDELARLEAVPGHRPFVARLDRPDSPAGAESSSSPSLGAKEPRIVFRPGIHARLLQAAWLLLLVLFVPLAFRSGRAAGTGGVASVAAALLPAAFALLLQAGQPARPLHPNGHAWREARELLSPLGVRDLGGLNPYQHGRGGLALQWLALPRPAGLLPASSRPLPCPLDAGRVPIVLAAAATALLGTVLTGRAGAGLLAGLLSALHPLSLFLGSSGSTLSAAAFALPLSLALLVSAKASGDRALFAGAGLAAALATSSHSAAVLWPFALAAAWLALPPQPSGKTFGKPLLLAAATLVAAEGVFQLASVLDLGAGAPGGGAVAAGSLARQLPRFLPREVLLANGGWSPLVLPALALLAACGAKGDPRRRPGLASALALGVGSLPFLSPHGCLSDLVRYQAPLVGILCALGAAGLVRASELLGRSVGPALVLLWLLTTPPASSLPVEPDVAEQAFLAQVLPSLAPGTLVEIPPRALGENVLAEFPDTLVPPGVSVARAGSPEAAAHGGPRVAWVGLACFSRPWPETRPSAVKPAWSGLRPECAPLLEGRHSLLTTTLSPAEIPLRGNGAPWTFLSVPAAARYGFWASGDRARWALPVRGPA